MLYLRDISLLTSDEESEIAFDRKRLRIHNNSYPVGIFPSKELEDITFDRITIFYGGNGSGKTTLLNLIADCVNASRRNYDDKGFYYNSYVSLLKRKNRFIERTCDCKKFISSDDVFDSLLDMRAINTGVCRRKEALVDEYNSAKFGKFEYGGDILNHYDELKNSVDAKRMTMSKYIRERLNNNTLIQGSNGETALDFWCEEIDENALYIIDEPENSLSAENQLKLKKFIEDSARFFNCQFVIATHSPFLLGLENSVVYDLDMVPVKVKKWTDLNNVRMYYEFFKTHEKEFE